MIDAVHRLAAATEEVTTLLQKLENLDQQQLLTLFCRNGIIRKEELPEETEP